MLRIIAENLAENAIRYAGRAATFTLSVRRDGDASVLLAVDDGVGVGPRDLPRLVERFWRADAARASRGTGLGLAIVKHVVTAAGGTIAASSAPGEGLRACAARSRRLERAELGLPCSHPQRRQGAQERPFRRSRWRRTSAVPAYCTCLRVFSAATSTTCGIAM